MVSIVILHWNNFRCTDFCLASLQNITYSNTEIIVVDNCSTDDSLERLKTKYPACTYLNASDNLGFARGSNIGMRYAFEQKADFVILLNNDVEVTPNFIEALIEPTLTDKNIGLVTPKILYRDKRNLIWHAGGYVNMSKISPVTRGYDEIDKGQYDEIVETQWASGACCLATRALIEKIGYLEERYFFGQEEWDYSTTAINNGFKIIYTPHAVLYHEIGQSSTKSPALYAYQNIYNKFVYASKFLTTPAYIIWCIKYFVHVLLFFPKKDLPNDSADRFYLKTAKRAAFWGIRDFFKGIVITSGRLKDINNKLLAIYKKQEA
jgi:GT2 family glycosyltransferase